MTSPGKTWDATSLDDVTVMTSLGNETMVDFEALNVARMMSLLPTIAYIVVLMVVGLVGNTVVLVVYYRRFKPSASRTYILAMSVCDLLANVLSLPSEMLDIRFSFTFDTPPLCRTTRLVNSFLALASGSILVAVARDRYNKICRVLDKPRSQARIKVYILICCLASLALSVVSAVLTGSHSIPTGVGNVTGITCSVDDVYRGTLFPLLYHLIMAVTFVGSVVTMGASYTAIALKLWRHNKKNLAQEFSEESSGHRTVATIANSSSSGRLDKDSTIFKDTSSGGRSDSSASGSRQVESTGEKEPSESGVTKRPVMSFEHKKPTSLLHKVFGVEKGQPQGSSTSCKTPKGRGSVKTISSSTTRMMFVLIVLFVINYFPYLIVLSVRAVSNNIGWELTGTLLNAYNIGLRSYFMNCAINPLVYGFFSPRFRQECRQLFCGQR